MRQTFMNSVGVPVFNFSFARFNPKVFFPKVNSHLKEVSPELLNRLQRYVTYVAISHCKYGFENWQCGRCEMTTMTAGTTFISRFIGPVYKHYGYTAVNHEHKEILINFNGASEQRHWALMMNEFKKVVVPISLETKNRLHIKGDVKVHQGLWKLFLDIYPEVLKTIKLAKSQYPDYQLVSNGHSMGGCFVSYLALQLALGGQIKDKMIINSFGTPRVGNLAFAKVIPVITKEAYRITHNSDTIVKVPPRVLGYRHYPTEIWIADKYIGKGKPYEPKAFKYPLGTEFGDIESHTYICDGYKEGLFRNFEDGRCLGSTPLHMTFRMSYNNSDPAQIVPIVPVDQPSISLLGEDPENLDPLDDDRTVKNVAKKQKKYKLFLSWVQQNYPISSNSFPNYYMHSTFWRIYSTSEPEHGLCKTSAQANSMNRIDLKQ